MIKKLTAAEKSLHRIWNTYRIAEEKAVLLGKNPGEDSDAPEQLDRLVAETREKFIAAMDDDFNTSLALACMFDLCRDVNGIINVSGFVGGEKTVAAIKGVLAFFGEINSVMNVIIPQEEEGADDMSNDLLNLLMEIRSRARSQKDWTTADFIRDELKKIGIVIEDTPDGPRWKKESGI